MSRNSRSLAALALVTLMLCAYAALMAPQEAFPASQVQTPSGAVLPVSSVLERAAHTPGLPEAALDSADTAGPTHLPIQEHTLSRGQRGLAFAGLLLMLAVVLFAHRWAVAFRCCQRFGRASLSCVSFMQAQHGPKDYLPRA